MSRIARFGASPDDLAILRASPLAATSPAEMDFEAREEIRRREVDEMIAMGWGNVSAFEIPADWRTRRGPDKFYKQQRAS